MRSQNVLNPFIEYFILNLTNVVFFYSEAINPYLTEMSKNENEAKRDDLIKDLISPSRKVKRKISETNREMK